MTDPCQQWDDTFDRSSFISADTKTFSGDAHFSPTLMLAILILWRPIRLAAQQVLDRAVKTGHRKQSKSLITLQD